MKRKKRGRVMNEVEWKNMGLNENDEIIKK